MTNLPYYQDQAMLLPPSLGDKVPQDHLARYISKVVDELDIRDIQASYSDLGRPAYHPRMLLKVLLYGYSTGLRSSRKIQNALREDIVYMWLSGMQEPDFRTISDFRKDRIKDIRIIFKQVLELCYRLGMIRCGVISLDGTKIEANSARYKLTYRKKLEKSKADHEARIDEILKEAERIDAEEDKLYGSRNAHSVDRPYSSEEIAKELKKLKREKEKLEREIKKVRAKASIVEEKIQQMGPQRNSFGATDQDATLMQMKDGALGVGYNLQMATENQVITGFGVYQNRADNKLLEPMVEEVTRNLGNRPDVIVADKGYASQSNYEYLDRTRIGAAIPPARMDYDLACRRRGTYSSSRNPIYEMYKIRMLDLFQSEAGKALLDRRKHDIEPTFGDIKQNMGFRKLLLRRLPRVSLEVGLVAIGHNLKKIKSYLVTPEMMVVAAR